MTSFVFQHLAEIEKLISIGVYQDAIRQKLADRGMAMSEGAFRKALCRARKKQLKLSDSSKATAAASAQQLRARVRELAVSGRRLSAHEFEELQRSEDAADSRSESALTETAKRN